MTQTGTPTNINQTLLLFYIQHAELSYISKEKIFKACTVALWDMVSLVIVKPSVNSVCFLSRTKVTDIESLSESVHTPTHVFIGVVPQQSILWNDPVSFRQVKVDKDCKIDEYWFKVKAEGWTQIPSAAFILIWAVLNKANVLYVWLADKTITIIITKNVQYNVFAPKVEWKSVRIITVSTYNV